jgi:hypothetical protein
MKWPSDGTIALIGTAVVIGVIIFVLPFLVPAGSASPVVPTNATTTVTYTPIVVTVTPTDWTYLPYIRQMRTPTPTPSTPYITIIPKCIQSPGTVIIIVRGENWPAADSRYIQITWNGQVVLEFSSRARWEAEFVRDSTQTQEGTYWIEAYMVDDPETMDFKEFTVPCPPIPTP